MEHTLEAFADTLLQEKKELADLPTEVRDQLRADLVERAENMINAEILAHMPAEHLEEFEKKLDIGDETEIQTFCQAHIANLDEVVATALVRLKDIYVGNAVA